MDYEKPLSVVGKIQIVKSLLASKFSYIGSIVDFPQVFMNRINSAFFKFLWGGSEKVKRSTLRGHNWMFLAHKP